MGDGNYQHPVALHWDQGPEKLKPLKNKLQLYFGSKSKSDGGECEIRDTDCTRGYILIYYKEEKTRDRVLQRKTHQLKLPNGTTLQLIVRLPEEGNTQNTQSSAPSGDTKTPPPTQEVPADHKVHQSPGEEEKPTREDDEVTQDPPSSLVLIENLQDSCTPEILNLLVENISEKNEDLDFHVERIPEIQSAVVTFTTENDIPDFIGRFSGSPRVKQQNLRAKCLENTRSVRVEGLPADISEDFLGLYFESAKQGGGPIEETEMLSEEGAAIIRFSSAKVVKTVLARQHTFHNSVLSVYPYYPSIGQWLYGKKETDIMTPGPVECPICAQMLEFIFNNEEIKQSIEKQMADHYCDVKWPKPGASKPLITLSFPRNLSTHLRTLSKRAPTWSNTVQTEFLLLMSKYKVIEYDLKPPVWEAIETKVSSSSYDGFLIKPDLAAEKAFIVGIKEDVEKSEPIFRKLVEETTRQLSRVEDEVPLEPAAYKLMLALGLEKSILEDSPYVKISYDGATKSIKLYGPKDEVLTAKCEILNTRQGLKSKSIHRDPSIIQFLMAVDNEKMSCNLLHNIKAMFQVEHNAVMVFGYSDNDLKNAEETLEKELACKQISVKDESVTQSPEWRNVKSFINEICNADGINVSIEELPVGDGNDVVITGLSSFVEETYQQIHDFVEKNTLVEKDIKLMSMAALQFMEGERKKEWNGILKNVKAVKKQNFLSLSGPKVYVEEAEICVTKIYSTLHSDTLYIDKPGAKKICIDNEDMYINTAKNKFGCVIYFQKDDDTRISGDQPSQAEPLCQVSLQNEVTIALYKDDLCQHNANAIIIASNKDLKPIGGPAMALLKAAGPKLQKECERIVQEEGELEPGENEITDVENLPYTKVIHTVAPKYSEKDKSKCVRLLRTTIARSLETAAGNVLNSAAISVASFILSGIPADICVENILKSIKQYAENEEGVKSIKNIHLVDNDDHTLKTLTKFLMEEYDEENVQVTPKISKRNYHGKKTQKKEDTRRKDDHSMVVTKEGVHVNVIHGNIEDTTANVVVNSVGKELELRSGAVSKALFAKAGNNLQDLLNTEKHGKEVKDGSVFVTDGCKLASDTVIHVVVPQWDGANGSSEKTLSDIIKKCLSEAEKRKKVSITFPAIGTGALAFPRATVAALMFEEILNFSSKDKSVHLKEVNILLHPNDTETIKAFSDELDKKTGSHKEGSVRSSAQGTHEMKIGPLTFQVKKGDVTMETADVIVSLSASGTKNLPDIRGTPLKKILISDTKPDELKQSVRNVLKDCERQKNTSVVLSATESGSGMASSDLVAEAVLDAVVQFVNHNSPKSVLMVKLITPLQQIVDDFLNAMNVKAGSAAAKQSSWLSGIAQFTKSIVGYMTRSNKEEEHEDDSKVFEFRENIEPAIIQLCAESQDAVDKTKVWLRDLIMKEQYENIITDDWIQEFDDKDHGALGQLQKTYQVTVIFDSPSSTIKVLGLSRDVLEVSNKIQEMIKSLRDKKTREREADLCSNLVEWGYLIGNKFTPFDKMTNMELEKANNEERQSIYIDINGAKYTVIVELLTARDPRGNIVRLQRNSKHEQNSLPSHWTVMKSSSVDVVQLVPKSEEYIKVQTEFERSCQMKIIKIERIQNKDLWLNYQIKKSSIEDKNKSQSERLLFHGTDAKTIDNVNRNGFNRSFAGKNNAKIGRGTYFAVEAIYSTDDIYSIPDQSSGYKHMYLARVLTGIFCKGVPEIIVPPSKDNANPTDLYDSVADDTTNPTVFAIFNDVQAYPEYLITFTQ